PQTQVAAFVDPNPFAVTADQSATINWGDGQSSTGLIKAINGTGALANQIDHYIVLGSHTYVHAGSFTVTVTIQDATHTAFGQPRVIHDARNAQAQALTAVPLAALNLVEGNPLPASQVVGSFKDGDLQAQASQYVARVDFGDGTTGIGSVVAN